ncbi:MAG: hypothetical protein QW203_07835 [Thermoplasmatales archaeon]
MALPTQYQIEIAIQEGSIERIKRIIAFLQDHRRDYANVDMLIDLAQERLNQYERPECNNIQNVRVKVRGTEINLGPDKAISECAQARIMGITLDEYFRKIWGAEDWTLVMKRSFAPTVSFVRGTPTIYRAPETPSTPTEPTVVIRENLAPRIERIEENIEKIMEELRKRPQGTTPTEEATKSIPMGHDFNGLKWSEYAIVMKNLKGHAATVTKSGQIYNIHVAKSTAETIGDFNQWVQDVEERLNEARTARLKRPAPSSIYELKVNGEERRYAESVLKRLSTECYEYRMGDMQKRSTIEHYINYALNLYFRGGEEEENSIREPINWDYMDASYFPLRELCAIINGTGTAREKLSKIEETIGEWANTSEGSFRFGRE